MTETTWVHMLTVVGAFVGMFYGLNIAYKRMKSKDQGFGPNSLKAIGISFFVPTLLILAVTTDFKAETLAALLGTVAGYVLSSGGKDE
ncbi:MAG: hypothetical protein OEX03_09415 [Gammaproteobacteria bacterium]|nr:hypothetical protein [Gammaproteobacteria bacterium]